MTVCLWRVTEWCGWWKSPEGICVEFCCWFFACALKRKALATFVKWPRMFRHSIPLLFLLWIYKHFVLNRRNRRNVEVDCCVCHCGFAYIKAWEKVLVLGFSEDPRPTWAPGDSINSLFLFTFFYTSSCSEENWQIILHFVLVVKHHFFCLMYPL